MPALTSRKNKITLSDYNYRRDIEIRLLMSDLTVFEVEALREILDNSLKISLVQLSETLNSSPAALHPILSKLAVTQLITLQGDAILVNKEMRKYYEAQILKFDEEFEPGMEFVQSLLNKVPVQFLPTWYSISRTSDNIFQTIIEKFFHTPREYERYLHDLLFDDDLLEKILKDVFNSPNFTIRAHDLKEKHKLSAEEFETAILNLEYNFACCLSYQKAGDLWEEIVTPFHEWHEYLLFRLDNAPQPISDTSQIKIRHPEEFGFVQDMSRVLKTSQKKPLPLQKAHESLPFIPDPDYLNTVIDRLQFLHLAKIENEHLSPLEKADKWLMQTTQGKALTLSRHPTQVEKSLKRVLHGRWVYVDEFLKGFIEVLSGKEPVTLRQKGKRWKYVLPSYTPQEMELIQYTLCQRLFEAGMISIGTHGSRHCFKVTPFGKMCLEE